MNKSNEYILINILNKILIKLIILGNHKSKYINIIYPFFYVVSICNKNNKIFYLTFKKLNTADYFQKIE